MQFVLRLIFQILISVLWYLGPLGRLIDLFCRFMENNWKEQDFGELKILRSASPAHMVTRHNFVLNISTDHYFLKEEMELNPALSTDGTWVWFTASADMANEVTRYITGEINPAFNFYHSLSSLIFLAYSFFLPITVLLFLPQIIFSFFSQAFVPSSSL